MLAGCGGEQAPPAPPPPQVTVATPLQREVVDWDDYTGRFVAPQDVEIRTLGLRRAAWATWAKLSPELSGQLKSYADGVNYWLSTNPVPLEHQALELSSADRWTPVDSLVIGKLVPLAVFSDERIAAMKNVPTMKEVGYNVVSRSTRGVVAPAGISKAEDRADRIGQKQLVLSHWTIAGNGKHQIPFQQVADRKSVV